MNTSSKIIIGLLVAILLLLGTGVGFYVQSLHQAAIDRENAAKEAIEEAAYQKQQDDYKKSLDDQLAAQKAKEDADDEAERHRQAMAELAANQVELNKTAKIQAIRQAYIEQERQPMSDDQRTALKEKFEADKQAVENGPDPDPPGPLK